MRKDEDKNYKDLCAFRRSGMSDDKTQNVRRTNKATGESFRNIQYKGSPVKGSYNRISISRHIEQSEKLPLRSTSTLHMPIKSTFQP